MTFIYQKNWHDLMKNSLLIEFLSGFWESFITFFPQQFENFKTEIRNKHKSLSNEETVVYMMDILGDSIVLVSSGDFLTLLEWLKKERIHLYLCEYFNLQFY